jgi:hypothetical protein
MRAGVARKQTHAEVGNHGGVSSPLGAELMNVGPDFQAFVKRSAHSQAWRSAAVGSFYLVFFAPASTEQFPWSLGCEFSQVVIDCVSEADILLLMQSQ